MRYSFHGKVRANGQQVDGFVEAANATEAIDRLADRGIIGVYSVRPEPKPIKNAVRLAGEAEPPEEKDPRHLDRRQLPGPVNNSRTQKAPAVVPRRIATAPQQKPATSGGSGSAVPLAPAPVAASGTSVTPAATPATEALLLQVVEKLSMLMNRVENALSRPMNVMYQAGPVRSTGFTAATKKSGRIPQDVQTNTLHDIFQNNLDLRKSLDKLASTVGTSPANIADPAPQLPAAVGASSGANGKSGHNPAPAVELPPTNGLAPIAPVRETQSHREPAREIPKPVREPTAHAPKLAVQAQPV